MTLIEIFDKTPVDNIITTLAFKPDRVIFVGSDPKRINRELPLYKSVLNGRGIKTEMTVKSVAKNNLDGIVKSLYDIISDREETYIVDFSGGDESSLVAVGMVLGDSTLAAKRICAFRINAISRRGVLFEAVYDEFGNRKIERQSYDFSYKTQVYLTAEENIIIHGGRVFDRGEKFSRGDSVCGDINIIWEICKNNCSEWNSDINRFSAEVSAYSAGEELYLIARDSIGHGRGMVSLDLWNSFVESGLVIIEQEKCGKGTYVFRYKNRIVYECLNKAGSALEYYAYKNALETKRDGEPLFDDAEVGIVIGWNDEIEGTRNEIDIMLMHGTVPIFISCKNGDVKTDELYKLETVSKQFGGDYSERVLMSTVYFDSENRAYNGDKSTANFRDRAEDMGVRLISNVHKKGSDRLKNELARLV